MSRRPRRAADPTTALVRRTSWRLGLQAAALVLACLALVSTLVLLRVARAQSEQISYTLDDAVTAAVGPGRATSGGSDDDARSDGVTATLSGGQVVADEAMPAGLPDRAAMDRVQATGVTERSRLELGGRHYALATEKRGDVVVQAVLDLYELQEEWQRLVSAIVVASLVGLLGAVVAAVWLARRAVAPMAEALAVQRRFVADAGHELRTPLTLLSTRAQLLRRRLAPGRRDDPAQVARVEQDLDGLVADTRSLTDLLEELLLAADTSAPAAHEPVDVAAVVGQVGDAARAAAEARGLVLVTEAGPSLTVTASRPALVRAVTALVDNALEHARHEVRVVATGESRRVRLAVLDDGPGIADEEVAAVFERFHSARTGRDGEGRRHYGLGLALVSDVVASLGGSVEAGRRADGASGAVLTLLLPRKAAR